MAGDLHRHTPCSAKSGGPSTRHPLHLPPQSPRPPSGASGTQERRALWYQKPWLAAAPPQGLQGTKLAELHALTDPCVMELSRAQAALRARMRQKSSFDGVVGCERALSWDTFCRSWSVGQFCSCGPSNALLTLHSCQRCCHAILATACPLQPSLAASLSFRALSVHSLLLESLLGSPGSEDWKRALPAKEQRQQSHCQPGLETKEGVSLGSCSTVGQLPCRTRPALLRCCPLQLTRGKSWPGRES